MIIVQRPKVVAPSTHKVIPYSEFYDLKQRLESPGDKQFRDALRFDGSQKREVAGLAERLVFETRSSRVTAGMSAEKVKQMAADGTAEKILPKVDIFGFWSVDPDPRQSLPIAEDRKIIALGVVSQVVRPETEILTLAFPELAHEIVRVSEKTFYAGYFHVDMLPTVLENLEALDSAFGKLTDGIYPTVKEILQARRVMEGYNATTSRLVAEENVHISIVGQQVGYVLRILQDCMDAKLRTIRAIPELAILSKIVVRREGRFKFDQPAERTTELYGEYGLPESAAKGMGTN